MSLRIQGYDPDDLDALPKSLRIYGASDFATMEPRKGRKEPDFTEHGVWGVDRKGELWAIDWFFKQCETDKGIEAFVSLIKRHKPIKWANEGGLIDKAIGPAIRSSMLRANAFVAIEMLPSMEDKAIKVQGFHARATAGTVHFPIKRPWADRVIEQLVKFPGGRWDDAVDVCGLIGRLLDKMVDARLPLQESRQLLVPFTEAWLEYGSENSKPRVRYW
jgi:predicted phage terminase large subunit-like protein